MKKYKIENNEVIFAKDATEFVTKLRQGSYFDYNCSNRVFKIKFAERFKTITGKEIQCIVSDNNAFVDELLKHGFVKSIEEHKQKLNISLN